MGIINLTEDSFYPNSRVKDNDQLLLLAETMLSADIIDIGAESTRPYSVPVPAKQQIAKLVPAIKTLRKSYSGLISIDTSDTSVMEHAISCGADMINDVRALSAPGALELIAESNVYTCITHMQGSPENMQDNPKYPAGVVSEVNSWCEKIMGKCMASGIDPEKIVLDPGFGFGKSTEHNWQLLAGLEQLTKNYKIMIGVSNKSMFKNICDNVNERSLPSRVAEAIATMKGVHMIRTHDPIKTKQAIMVANHIGG